MRYEPMSTTKIIFEALTFVKSVPAKVLKSLPWTIVASRETRIPLETISKSMDLLGMISEWDVDSWMWRVDNNNEIHISSPEVTLGKTPYNLTISIEKEMAVRLAISSTISYYITAVVHFDPEAISPEMVSYIKKLEDSEDDDEYI